MSLSAPGSEPGSQSTARASRASLHAEAGHLPVIRLAGDELPSTCPFHPHCAEGLAAGPAVRRRLGEGQDLADDPAVIELVADYLGQLGASLVLAGRRIGSSGAEEL